ncbi:NADP oxidoreductase coenzyme F420-dependent [Croceitalea dokdonensis DOKDO 023]|uniref:NADP oxidoreductase coenzyme F420-dependent n=1 Tax=Croceitalea dokdonensis DOKDO 023 TaxID=1300341 RepID=A0A0P7B228_9FLAO|nr:NAD(P)-binding domain-containing protein [Croceitalea dokdonensis]KPM32150.1 NADP oxidoreductase coenzyme F420-dependent [Croceitalea dokdonensis DOKDO 023]
MKIGIIGSGNIGGNLGKHWAKVGHEVIFSSRNPEELGSLVAEANHDSKARSVTETFEANADVYVLAMPFKAIDKIAELYAGEYADSIILDVTNPYPERDGAMAQKVRDANYCATEYTAMKFSTARTAKAFNTIQSKHLKDRAFRTQDRLAIPFAAQDGESKHIVQQLIEDIGFDAVYIGNLSDTKAMDPEEKLYGISTTKNELRKLLNL